MHAQFPIEFSYLPLIIGAFLSLLCSQLLIWRHLDNKLGNRLLAGIVLVMGFVCLDGMLMLSPSELYPLWLLRTSGVVATLYGPLLFLYIKAFTTKDFRLQPKHAIHLLPAVLFLIATVVIFRNETEVLERIRDFRENVGQGSSPRIPGLGLVLLALFYFILSFRLVRKFRIHVASSSSFIDQDRFRWLMFLFGVLLLPVLSAFFTFILIQLTPLVIVPGFGASIFILLIHLLYILKPEIFSGYPLELRINEDAEKRYESSPLSPEQKEKYLEKLLVHMEREQSYLKPELTLSELANELSMNTRYLSQVINEKRNMNFMDFINGYRIDLAQDLLKSKSHKNFTVLAIAQESGFKSRSAFYEAFRKQTGTTPANFRKSSSG
ncbi:MAG: helix-turn-helix domain-containing protein [Bacteroidota bacterium]